jgi:hypothetical protein
MKTIKCIISVIVGAGLGLISACCGHRAGPAPSSTPTGTSTATGSQTNVSSAPKSNALPANQENLPVRKPTLE